MYVLLMGYFGLVHPYFYYGVTFLLKSTNMKGNLISKKGSVNSLNFKPRELCRNAFRELQTFILPSLNIHQDFLL